MHRVFAMYSQSGFWYIPGILTMVCGHLESLWWFPSESRIICNFRWGVESVLAFYMVLTLSRQSKKVLSRFVLGPHLNLKKQAPQLRSMCTYEWNWKKVHMNLIKAQTTIFCVTRFYFAIRNCIALTRFDKTWWNLLRIL